MVQRTEIIEYINDLLNISEFDDYCVNGLQVQGKDRINKIALGVSVSARLFEESVKINADMIIVHHGLFWKNSPSPFSITGVTRNRLALLIKNDINLCGYHLPLDAHPEIGNNAQILKELNIQIIEPVNVGFLGQISPAIERDDFVSLVDKKLGTKSMAFPFGPSKIEKVVTISGGSSYSYKLAVDCGADTFLAGDIKENIVRELEEYKMNFINAGHYNTEKFGIQALGEKVSQEFNISCEYIDIPNPV